MKRRTPSDQPQPLSRRAALRRLAGAVVAAYVVPEVLVLSEARADESGNSAPTTTSEPTGPSVPDPSSPSGPSGAEGDSSGNSDHTPSDNCHISGPSGANTISISRSDLSRSQDAVEAGYAQPLDQIWGHFNSQYDGRIIGVEFTGRRQNSKYRFRAISSTGRLETVTISASTGDILRIVGC